MPTQIFKPQVLFFYAEWCGPSQAFKKILFEALLRYKDEFQNIEEHNVDMTDVELLSKYKVLGIPTAVLISRYKRELGRLIGYNSYEYTLRFLNKGVL